MSIQIAIRNSLYAGGLAALCAAGLGACSTSIESELSGHWIGHTMESRDGRVTAARAGWARGTSLTFDGSSLSVALPGEAPRTGEYRVISNDDGQLEIEVTGHAGHVDTARLTLETERLLRWHLTDVHTLVLHRE